MNTVRTRCVGLLALLCLLTLSLTTEAAPTEQIPAGSTSSVGPGAKTAAPPNTPQGKILQNALTKQTRQTLQDAMNSEPAPH